MATETVAVRINGKAFEKGLKYARKAGGKYNPATKTWAIPATCNMLNAPEYYGWLLSAVPARERDDSGNCEAFADTWERGWSYQSENTWRGHAHVYSGDDEEAFDY